MSFRAGSPWESVPGRGSSYPPREKSWVRWPSIPPGTRSANMRADWSWPPLQSRCWREVPVPSQAARRWARCLFPPHRLRRLAPPSRPRLHRRDPRPRSPRRRRTLPCRRRIRQCRLRQKHQSRRRHRIQRARLSLPPPNRPLRRKPPRLKRYKRTTRSRIDVARPTIAIQQQAG